MKDCWHFVVKYLLCDTSHVFQKVGAETITVTKGAYSVDFVLVNMVKKGDVVITQDYGLAVMCLAKRAIVISQNGLIYDDSNIDALLLKRHTAKKIRMASGILKVNSKRRLLKNADSNIKWEANINEFTRLYYQKEIHKKIRYDTTR